MKICKKRKKICIFRKNHPILAHFLSKTVLLALVHTLVSILITQLVFLITRDRTQIIYHAAKYSRCSVYAASAWKTKIRDAYDEWWRCRRPADPLPLNILTLFVWIPLFGLVRSHHVVVSSLLLLMEKILSKILPLGYSRKFFVSDQFFRFSSIFRSIFSSIRFFFSLIRFLINSKSNKCKLSAVLQKIILGWIQRKKMEFFGNRFLDHIFSVWSENDRF